MFFEPTVSTALAFFLLFAGICHYVAQLPRAGSTDVLNSNDRHVSGRGALRPYFGGRILFTPITPSGLSLSRHARSTSDDSSAERSGFMTQHVAKSLMDFRLYAGVKLSLEQLVQLTASQLPHLSKAAKKKLLPSQVCCLGFGFLWQPKHTRRLHDLMEVGIHAASSIDENGSPDLHGVEDLRAFEPIFFSTKSLLGHTPLLGTTGSGKTRFFDLLVSQAIMRGDTVIVIDPKGDRSLQQSILRAARFAGREPLENIYCLDIGRKQAAPLTSIGGQNFAQHSNGLVTPLGANNQSASSLETPCNSNIQSIVSMATTVNANTRASPNLKQHPLSLLPEENGQWQASLKGTPSSAATAADGYLAAEAMTPLLFSPSNTCNNGGAVAVARASGSATGKGSGVDEAQESAWFFDHINTGFNSTSAFDRASEIGSRLTAMMPDNGSASNFKAYANMAVSAAVECCLLSNTKVSLEKIRSVVSNHDAFVQAFRTFLNRTVIELNLPEVTKLRRKAPAFRRGEDQSVLQPTPWHQKSPASE